MGNVRIMEIFMTFVANFRYIYGLFHYTAHFIYYYYCDDNCDVDDDGDDH